MNRIEYMTKLASLLQDIPEVERRDAMKYYNDYFDPVQLPKKTVCTPHA